MGPSLLHPGPRDTDEVGLQFYTPGPCLVASQDQVHSDMTSGLFRPHQLLGLPRALCSGGCDGSEVRVTLLSAQQPSVAPGCLQNEIQCLPHLIRPPAPSGQGCESPRARMGDWA